MDRAVRKGKQVACVNQLTESDKKQMKLMNTVREFDPWTETRLANEICRGEQGDLMFIKARHGPRAQGQPTLSLTL